jgi:hypothetical protein
MRRNYSSVTSVLTTHMKPAAWVSHFGRGVREDYNSRIGWYVSDWADALTPKVLASTLFIFFTSLAPAITFSLLLTNVTNGQIGAIEVLLSMCITGVLFALFSGQPLVIVGVTGPVSILTINIYTLSKQWGVNFLPFYAWSQIWAAFIMILLALFNACDTLKYFTRFSCEIFGVLIALLYLYTGIEGIAKCLGNQDSDLGVSLLQFVISMGTFWLAQTLSSARQWSCLNNPLRELVADYGATVSILLWSVVPTLAQSRLPEDAHIPTLYVPLTFATTSGRSWLVDMTDLPVWAAFAALFPGIIIAVLFFFDHNVSSILTQDAEFKLRKGQAFHFDILIVGFTLVLTGVLGLPPTNGLIPQAPLHAKSLRVLKPVSQAPSIEGGSKRSDQNGPVERTSRRSSADERNPPDAGTNVDSSGDACSTMDGANEVSRRTASAVGRASSNSPTAQLPAPTVNAVAPMIVYEVSHTHEQRVSNFLQSALCGVVCLKPFSYALRSIPTAVLYGLFLFLGVSSFEGNEFAYRMYMLCMEPRLRLQCTHRYRCASARFQALRDYTALQMILCGEIFGVTFTPAGVVFPVLIAALIAVREFLLPRWFDKEQLVLLDSPILPAVVVEEANEREVELTGVC